MPACRQVLVVGGGTAGWLTAAYLARSLGSARGGVQVSLVEAPGIAPMGVGEGSFPSLRSTLSHLGLDEADFMQRCQATWKQGIRFDHWLREPGTPGVPSGYLHPFNTPSQRPGGPDLVSHWVAGHAPAGRPFAEAVSLQAAVVAAGRAPKRAADGPWQGPMNHAYHFDAGALAQLLSQQAQRLGVRHVPATVERASLDERGHIAALHTPEAGDLHADLYVDCTGLRASLIGDALGQPLRPVADTLFVDRALALQVPWPAPDTPIPPVTISTAQSAGWIWDIGLQQRRGVGHVYASRYCDDDTAERALRAHVGPAADGLEVRRLEMRLGWREQAWVGNCVAVGLSGGFLEPLEASGVGLVETAAYLLAHRFPHDGDFAAPARFFNHFMSERYRRIVDFIKLHYALTQRRDSAFWRDNADPASWPESLREHLAAWRLRPPHRLDFNADLEMYPPSSWQYVLYGMGYATDPAALRPVLGEPAQAAAARDEFARLAQVGTHAVADLPPHRALLARQAEARAGAAAARAATLAPGAPGSGQVARTPA